MNVHKSVEENAGQEPVAGFGGGHKLTDLQLSSGYGGKLRLKDAFSALGSRFPSYAKENCGPPHRRAA
ncbi:MAG: hypothetical protein ACREI9_13570 [Nitrospiraceae bacterium]